ncbi:MULTISPECIES: hypothetical protein [Microbacterium]|uniref:hypothetical protein n=1 Tax=Microbacterium TaxID=33882 RepID=UPI00344FC067
MTGEVVNRPKFSRTIFALRILLAIAGAVAALTAFLSWSEPDNALPRLIAVGAGIFAAVTTFAVWILEEMRKKALEKDKKTVERLLEAERVRVLTVTNGAFLPTLLALQRLAAIEIGDRRNEISGFRQSVVERVCDLVQNEQPRAAYFRVQDLGVSTGARVMKPGLYIAQRSRTDEFTTEFVEGSGIEPGVWSLIDSSDQAIRQDEVNLPGKAYHAYISAPVRAGGIAFGMLTVNVPEAGGLSLEDQNFVLVLARLLAVAESISLSAQQRGVLARV